MQNAGMEIDKRVIRDAMLSAMKAAGCGDTLMRECKELFDIPANDYYALPLFICGAHHGG